MLCQMVFMLEGLGAKSAGKGSLAGVFIFVTCKGAVLGEDLAALVADVPTSSDRCRRWNPMLWLCRPAHRSTQLVNIKYRSDLLWISFLPPEWYSPQSLIEVGELARGSGDEELEEAEVEEEMLGTWSEILTPLLAESWESSPSKLAPRS